jgi:peptidoglycan/xylan/chitin deacetylase (PgdA/CDA1 family)
MKKLRGTVIRLGLDTMAATGAYRLLQPLTGGVGFILMLHHVRPTSPAAFQPNRHLEITPDFLGIVLSNLRARDIDIVSLDEARRRLTGGQFERRFAVFTFDDGYRDNRDYALPIMRRYDAPMTVYVASDFAAGTGRLWWVALERIVAQSEAINIPIEGVEVRIEAATPAQKQAAFARLHDHLRRLPTDRDINAAVGQLARRCGIDDTTISHELCMSWNELKAFAADPLVTIGAHTISHCNLAHEGAEQTAYEIATSRARIAAALERPVRHFAYPYGDKAAAGRREFDITTALGFDTAVTTRPGMLFPGHADHLTALPRLSLNGNFQTGRALSVLTSGAATALWNGFRRVDVR